MAGRPRLPKNVHYLKGTDKKNPKRLKERENEPENVDELGDPPARMTAAGREAWQEIVSNSIPGVLGKADRLAVEVAADLLLLVWGKKRRKNAKGKMVIARAGPQDQNLLFRYLGQFGMLPADRSKIALPPKPTESKFDKFSSR